MDLVQELIQKQEKEQLSDRKFARKLGVSQPLWTETKKGNVRIGQKLLRAALREYPTLSDSVLRHLSAVA